MVVVPGAMCLVGVVAVNGVLRGGWLSCKYGHNLILLG